MNSRQWGQAQSGQTCLKAAATRSTGPRLGAPECREPGSLPASVGYKSKTTAEVGREQQINALPSAGGSTGSGS